MEVFKASQEHVGQRLDQWLAIVAGVVLSRSRVKAMITAGEVTLNGHVVKEPKRKIALGDVAQLSIPEAEPAEPVAQNIALDILYEDEHIIVINKPSGLIVHPGAGNPDGTLVNALLYHCGDSLSGIGGVKRPGIVHRLDKETSGVMVSAKNDAAHQHLSAQFADHGRTGHLQRVYRAICWNAPPTMNGTIDNFLGRSSSDRTKQAIVTETQPDARHAITHYTVLERYGQESNADPIACLVDCRLETGRTHQIRVHMTSIGNPLVGDHVYGAGYKSKTANMAEPLKSTIDSFHRQALHARSLIFEHPANGQVMQFDAPLPADMQAIADAFTSL